MVLLGTLAAHLDQGDTERAAIVQTLLDVLGTPSEAVQRAVSSRLAPLMPGEGEGGASSAWPGRPAPLAAPDRGPCDRLLQPVTTSRVGQPLPGCPPSLCTLQDHAPPRSSKIEAATCPPQTTRPPQGMAEDRPTAEASLNTLQKYAPLHPPPPPPNNPPTPPGMAEDRPTVEAVISRLLSTLKDGASFGARRGAAFGLAGVVKGLGIASLKG